MPNCRAVSAALLLTVLLVGANTSSALAQSRREERNKAAKMAKLDAEIEQRRAEAPIPDEGTTDMNGVDLHKKRQMEVIRARLGQTTLGAPDKENQQEDASASGFAVREFKGSRAQRERERKGYTPPVRGSDPPGKPLVHKERHRKHFLFF